MHCEKPIIAYRIGQVNCKSDNVRSNRYTFSTKVALDYIHSLGLPEEALFLFEQAFECGKCFLCQIRKRKDMSVRLAKEASMYDKCCFITLTYDEKHVPVTDGFPIDDEDKFFDRGFDKSANVRRTLLPIDVQLFIKRLRRHLEYVPKKSKLRSGRDHVERIRYFAVGEYGSRTNRPHYHLLIFGWYPSDIVSLDGKINTSGQIAKLWKYGFHHVDQVNTGVAKYCARYVTKKFSRDPAKENTVFPEFVLSSKGRGEGGIGAPWFDKYGEHSCRCGYVCVPGKKHISKCAVPRYFWNRLRNTKLQAWLECRDQKINWRKAHPAKPTCFDDLIRMEEFYAYQTHNEAQHEKI